MTEILNFNSPIADEAISDFEKKVDLLLPDDYKEFLKTYNGGQPVPNAFRFYAERDDGSSVDWFLSLGKEKYSNLQKYYQNFKERIPADFLPIAHDAGGNLIILANNEENTGIYFWDHEYEADEGEIPTMDNVYFIAKSFSDFLKNLHETEL
ncbi:SMI1/KNR4 family protein [Cronobacter dublinensis]|nr:SMI1/KNR4 family protein [Cronobacter dublinensis]ELY4512858.1 SMI1/KNR4 family protein [Cronobacter dublinensis]EMA8656527.1 SMI1/KNR4 family protein [Cronobacter dublinensis]